MNEPNDTLIQQPTHSPHALRYFFSPHLHWKRGKRRLFWLLISLPSSLPLINPTMTLFFYLLLTALILPIPQVSLIPRLCGGRLGMGQSEKNNLNFDDWRIYLISCWSSFLLERNLWGGEEQLRNHPERELITFELNRLILKWCLSRWRRWGWGSFVPGPHHSFSFFHLLKWYLSYQSLQIHLTLNQDSSWTR